MACINPVHQVLRRSPAVLCCQLLGQLSCASCSLSASRVGTRVKSLMCLQDVAGIIKCLLVAMTDDKLRAQLQCNARQTALQYAPSVIAER